MFNINPQRRSVINDLLDKEGVQFRVPYFQRSYVWGSDMVSELWEDLKLYITTPAPLAGDYFLGTVILCKDDAGANRPDVRSMLVVDGQQRLTTLTILLRAMHDQLDPDSELAGNIYKCIQGYRYEANAEPYYKLVMGEDAKDFFERFIQDKDPNRKQRGKRKAQKNIRAAYEYFTNILSKEIKQEGKDAKGYIDALFRKLKAMVIVELSVDDDADAYQVFETINSKKVDLTVSELLKNFVYYQNKESKANRDRVHEQWSEMVENLYSASVNLEASQYVRHFWISQESQITKKELYRAIKNKYKNDAAGINRFVTSLAGESLVYSDIYRGSGETLPGPIVHLVARINSLGVLQLYPTILSGIAADVSDDIFGEFLSRAVSVSFWRGVAGKNPNELEDFYGKLAREVRQKGNSALVSAREDLTDFMPKEEEVRGNFIEGEWDDSLARFCLVCIEEVMQPGEEKKIASSKVSLEHVMPQKPEKLKDWGIRDLETHEDYLHRIGNLTLLARRLNSSIQNKKFEIKKGKYLSSAMDITLKLGKFETWGPEQINERSEAFFEKMKAIVPLKS
jgi:uncharacterized protein with ParB-like and HNH nuclease domain